MYFNRALANNLLDRHAVAISDCNKAIEKNPDFVKGYNLRGYSHGVLGQLTDRCIIRF